jgi:hypothetical protein
MRGDHNLVEPVIPARAKFRCPATKLWRNISSYRPQDAVNVPAEPANLGSNHLAATELLHERNRSVGNAPASKGSRSVLPDAGISAFQAVGSFKPGTSRQTRAGGLALSNVFT